jgi:hypothetical protein
MKGNFMTRLLNGLCNSSRQRTLFFLTLFVLAIATACSNAPQNTTSQNTAPGASPAPAASPDAAAPSSLSTAPAGSFEGAITANLYAAGQPSILKYAIKGQRARVETNLAQGGTATAIILMDLAVGSQTMLMPQAKTYMTLDLNDEKLKGMAERMGKSAGDQPMKITATGKTETLAGHTCEYWVMNNGQQQTEMCFAKGLGFFGGATGPGGVLSQLKNLPFGEQAKATLDANPEFARFAAAGAFPLKISQVENGQAKPILEVTSVERKPLDDALFNVPADYKKMNLPGIGAK